MSRGCRRRDRRAILILVSSKVHLETTFPSARSAPAQPPGSCPDVDAPAYQARGDIRSGRRRSPVYYRDQLAATYPVFPRRGTLCENYWRARPSENLISEPTHRNLAPTPLTSKRLTFGAQSVTLTTASAPEALTSTWSFR